MAYVGFLGLTLGFGLAGVALPLISAPVAGGQYAALFAPGTDLPHALSAMAAQHDFRLVHLSATWPLPVLLLATSQRTAALPGAWLIRLSFSAGCSPPPQAVHG